MSSNNKIIEEIKKRSSNYYKQNLDLFESNKISDIGPFVNLIFSDIINIEQMKENELLELFNIIKDPRISENYFNRYNEKLTQFQDSSNIYTNEIKKRVSDKIKQLIKKVIECNQHIDIIKKYYINLVISERLNTKNTVKSDLSIKNKSVLYLIDKKERYKIAEILTRYMIVILKVKNNSKISTSDINEYYNESKIFNFINSTTITDYKSWEPQIKYFIVQMILIDILFEQNSEFKKIFNADTLKKYIEEFIKPDKKDDKKNKNKNKNKKKNIARLRNLFKTGGGINTNIKNVMKQNNKKPKKPEYKKPEYKTPNKKPEYKTPNKKINNKTKNNSQSATLKKGYIEVMKNTEVNKQTLNTIFYSNLKYKLTQFFIEIVKKENCSSNTDNIQISANTVNPFYPSEKLFYNNYFSSIPKDPSTKQNIQKYSCSEVNSRFHDFKFNIFNTFIVYKNSENYAELNAFIKNVKLYITFILFSLYNTKKKIYEAYINSAKSVFSFDINQLSKEAIDDKKTDNIEKNKENKSKKSKPVVPINIESKSIDSVKKKLDILETQYENINDDKKKLKLQKLQHKMIIEKLSKK